MGRETQAPPDDAIRRQYLRPLWLAIIFSMAGELIVFLFFGLMLSGPDNWLIKLVWAVGFCGIGMGSAVGASVDLLIVSRMDGLRAIAATCLLSTAILGVACNLLCWQLDHGLHYFGGAEHPALFLVSGIVAAVAGGTGIGMLLFTESGESWLDRRGL